MLDLNRQSIEPQAGDGVYAPQPARTFKLASDVAAPVGATTPCKLAGKASTGMPIITPITAATDVVYCVIANNLRHNTFAANGHVKAWVADEVVWLKASAAITSGKTVQADVAGTVSTQVAANPVLGIAESSAFAAGDLVAVRLTCPYNVYGAAAA